MPSGAKLEDHFEVSDWVQARILRIKDDKKKVGLTMRGLLQPSVEEVAELTAADEARRGTPSREAAKESVVVDLGEPERQQTAKQTRKAKGAAKAAAAAPSKAAEDEGETRDAAAADDAGDEEAG